MVNQDKPIKVYTNDVTLQISEEYRNNPTEETVDKIAAELKVSKRSVIAKLSSLGIYIKKPYLTKRGELPVSKEVYIERIGKLLDIDSTMLDSMEKVTKQSLVLIESRIRELVEDCAEVE